MSRRKPDIPHISIDRSPLDNEAAQPASSHTASNVLLDATREDRGKMRFLTPPRGARRLVATLGLKLDSLELFGQRDIASEITEISSEPVARGGLADIFTGQWNGQSGQIKVAIKVLRVLGSNPETNSLRKRLRREVVVWRKLQHRNILPLYGVHTKKGIVPALVSPWYANGDINNYLRTRNADLTLKLGLLEQALHGLRYLHTHDLKIVHGDLKGANILVNDLGEAVLADFGFASMRADHSASFILSPSSAMKGTYRWMAPELFGDGDSLPHTTRSDIWAFGCVVLEVLGGRPPFQSKKSDQAVIIALHSNQGPERPSTLTNDDCWAFIQDCCMIQPTQRPEIRVLLQRLRALHDAQAVQASRTSILAWIIQAFTARATLAFARG